LGWFGGGEFDCVHTAILLQPVAEINDPGRDKQPPHVAVLQLAQQPRVPEIVGRPNNWVAYGTTRLLSISENHSNGV
jgi:hypothetical protein